MTRRAWQWMAMGTIVFTALAVAALADRGPATDGQRVSRIAAELRCPTCQGLSVADSDAPAARALREEIARRVSDGETDGEIFEYVESRFGSDIRLAPEPTGVASLVWFLPVIAAVAVVAGLGVTFWRRRRRQEVAVSEEDRLMVDEALRR